MVENRILKENARRQLGGNIFANGWLMMLLACFIYNVIVGLSGTFLVVAILIGFTLFYGLSRCKMNVLRGIKKNADIGDLFVGFSECYGDTLALGFLQGLFILLWSLLFIIPGIIKSYSYSMAFYIQQDSVDKSWNSCMDRSKQMMDGHKGQLFLLDLSFIGWYILGSLCFGIGALFVVPYHEMAKANFYEALRAQPGNNII